MPLACIIRARTHDQKNDCFFDLEMINDDYNYARGGFPLETYQPPMYARTSGAGTGTPPPPPPPPGQILSSLHTIVLTAGRARAGTEMGTELRGRN